MPLLPKEDESSSIRTRSQRHQEMDRGRFEDSPAQAMLEQTTRQHPAGPSGVSTASTPTDLMAIMAMLQEQARRQEEQARRQEEQMARLQEEQARRQEEQMARLQEEQARRQEEQMARLQEEQARRQEDQARRQEEQIARLLEEQTARQEEQIVLIKELRTTIGQELKVVKDQVDRHEQRISDAEARIADVEKKIETRGSGPVLLTPSSRGFKVPPFDGTSSWSAYKMQFEAVMQANGWSKDQAKTALTLGLREQALTILEALSKDVTYDQLVEALESRYGDSHLEHVFRAQLKDRVQRSSENIQQWALEVEKLVRKAYQSSPGLVNGILVQAFVDGIRDLEVRAAVRLGHHETLKDALAHALEVEAVRQDHRAHRIREVTAAPVRRRPQGYSPRCFNCGEMGHLRMNCTKRRIERGGRTVEERLIKLRKC
ncbi:stress response protein NST1 [Manduca sexta]|uniref:stress response protein NST1 n=1 Tax=Manduca sexta TaxID=7130 RepID=UPI00188E4E77|nr:stress response protein NST1 [Manduca sexta]